MQVRALYRHPIKSHGREAIERVHLTQGQTMPWDRVWAVTHEATKFDADQPAWASCHNFMIGSRTPGLVGIWATLDASERAVTLTHQDLAPLTIQPDVAADVARFLDWVAPLCPASRAAPTAIVAVPDRGMTDSAYPSISIMKTASHHAVADALGVEITKERWRGNIWLDDIAAWAEFGWIGRDVKIGDAVLRICESIKRCPVTNTNPITGERDTATLDILNSAFGHQNFGVYAEVIKSGDIALGTKAEVI
ncbi:MOSC domain-containing protein [Sulfitobacter sp. CW3]|uniref:MOSC domain-containing protein n=1 Tax=Sulfitobacter sp. CW3 TaxID=2861965 RepID=UPI001C5DA0C3|nr:MOSC N-terminal beta barrel domain-containing protein [Sulfitobacter sp. CW3]MBW4961916.1 MOSC domain-containing protein [Sulfitobacter sp. CW3]